MSRIGCIQNIKKGTQNPSLLRAIQRRKGTDIFVQCNVSKKSKKAEREIRNFPGERRKKCRKKPNDPFCPWQWNWEAIYS